MARSRRFAAALVLVVSSLTSAAASAADFSLGGYYRMRFELFKSLSAGVGDEGVPNGATTGYWQHRVRLDPKIKLNENVSFYAQVDMLDNVVAGDNPTIDVSYQNNVTEFFSQTVAPQNDVNGDTRRNISVKRAWGEVMTGIGQLKFGRMGSHWGMGLLANDGNDWDADHGDTVDRVMFITKAGPLYIVPMIDKVSEGAFYSLAANNQKAFDIGSNAASLSNPNDDVDEGVLAVVYRGEASSGGVYGVFRMQPSTRATAYIADLWGKTKIGPVAVEAEGAYIQGKIYNFIPPNNPATLKANQWGVAFEGSVPLHHFKPGLMAGAASGDDKAGPSNGTLNNFFFDSDYRIAFLLFHFIAPANGPHAVTNCMYAKPSLTYEVWDNFELSAAVLYAQTMTDSPSYNSGSYGTEADVTATWKLYENFEAGVRYGALAPGAALKPTPATTKLDSLVQGVEGHFLIRF